MLRALRIPSRRGHVRLPWALPRNSFRPYRLRATTRAPACSGSAHRCPGRGPGVHRKTALLDTTGYSVGRRIFAPGSHNATWHMHAAGQLIFAESGHGRLSDQRTTDPRARARRQRLHSGEARCTGTDRRRPKPSP